MGLEEEEEEEKKEWREEVRKLALDTSNRTKLPTAECVNINVVLDKAASHARARTHTELISIQMQMNRPFMHWLKTGEQTSKNGEMMKDGVFSFSHDALQSTQGKYCWSQ